MNISTYLLFINISIESISFKIDSLLLLMIKLSEYNFYIILIYIKLLIKIYINRIMIIIMSKFYFSLLKNIESQFKINLSQINEYLNSTKLDGYQ